jgi:predicted alpha/beta-hydrolase family hydrolase
VEGLDLGNTTGTVYLADEQTGTLLVLAHGAGAGQQHPFMVRTARGLAARGVDVVTFDFPYMHARRKLPDRAPVLEDCFHRVIDAVREWAPELTRRLFIGGKSMGGRIATHLASQGLDGLHGTLALGYPLHPPGKPEQRRDAHLASIVVPTLFASGTRDTFGTLEELAEAALLVDGARVHVLDGADHGFSVLKASGRTRTDVWAEATAALLALIDSVLQ